MTYVHSDYDFQWQEVFRPVFPNASSLQTQYRVKVISYEPHKTKDA